MLRLLHELPDLPTLTGHITSAPPTVAMYDPAREVKTPLDWRIRNRFRMLMHGELFVPLILFVVRACRSRFVRRIPVLGRMIAGSIGSLMVAKATLWGTVYRSETRTWDRRLLGYHLIVTAGKNYLASCMDNTAEPESLKFHAFGTGSTAAAAGDTALQTECTTAYATDNTRPTGSQAHSTNTYTTVATFTPDAAVSNTEWGLLTQASNAGGTLLDHQVYSVVTLNGTGDNLATTYVLTFS
jgi:hypothetical protein